LFVAELPSFRAVLPQNVIDEMEKVSLCDVYAHDDFVSIETVMLTLFGG
jgi:hypothetical protein